MKRCFIILLAAMCATLSAVALSGCFGKKDKNEPCSPHSYGEYVEVRPSTCTKAGWAERTCEKCGEKDGYEIPASHNLSDTPIPVTEPTCTEIGWGKYKCTRCDYYEERIIPSTGHSYSEYLPVSAPTCTEQGVYKSECSKCHDVNYRYESALGHKTDEFTVTKAPTCTESGLKEGACVRCGEPESIYVPPTGHNFSDEYTVDIEQGCYTDGLESRHCINPNCTERFGERTVKAGHKFSEEWHFDEIYHWHEVLCEHKDLIGDTDIIRGIAKGEHAPSPNVTHDPNYCSGCEITHTFTLGLEYTLLEDGTYEVSGHRKMRNNTFITVPESVCGIPVTRLGYEALWNAGDLVTTVNLPKTITVIGDRALMYLRSLTELVLPEGTCITTIGDWAFSTCSSLTAISLPDTVTSVGMRAFSSCSSLTEISFNNCNIGDEAFSYCTSLKYASVTGKDSTIGTQLFINCSALERVVLPEGLTSIPSKTFSGCVSLVSVDIPETLTEITPSAFYNCSSLLTLTFPEGVTSIPESAFEGCESLQEITFKGDITSIGKKAFADCSALKVFDLSVNLTELGEYSFSDCASLKSITIPESITRISNYAFRGCTSLKDITLHDRLTVLGKYCFDGCTSINSFYFPQSLISIEEYALSNCTIEDIYLPEGISYNMYSFYHCNFIKVTAPASAVYYLRYTGSFSLLEEIEVYSGDKLSSSLSGLKNLKVAKLSTLTSLNDGMFSGCTALEQLDIENVKTIGKNAFADCAFEKFEIPQGVTSIGENAFNGCTNLKKLTLPFVGNSRTKSADKCTLGYLFGKTHYEGSTGTAQYYYVSEAGQATTQWYYIPSGLESVIVTEPYVFDGAFHNCTMLKTVEVRGDEMRNNEVSAYAFTNCTGLESVTLPSYKYIREYAFSGINVEIMLLSEGITTIGDFAFANCTGENLYINTPLAQLGNRVFENSAFKSATLIARSTGTYLFSNCANLESATFENIDTIKDYTFDKCHKLETVDVGDAAVRISSTAFSYTNGLIYNFKHLKVGKSFVGGIKDGNNISAARLIDILHRLEIVDVAEGNQNFSSLQGVLYNADKTTLIIAPRAIKGEIEIPESVKVVEEDALYDCLGIEALTVPDSITTIGDRAFRALGGLKRLTVGTKHAKNLAASGCKFTLVELNIHDGEIAADTFQYFSDLKRINLTNIAAIGSNAFAYCTSLTDINFNDGITLLDTNAFANCTSLTEVDMPNSIVTVNSAFEGCTSLERIRLSENLTTVSSFAGCSSLKEFNIPENCLTLSEEIFRDCTSLKTVNFLGSNIAKIPARAFVGCESLAEITLPEGITAIEDFAFEGCASLVYISLPESLLSINKAAFANCTKLISITLPENLTSIYTPDSDKATDAAFYGCYRLYEIYNNSALSISAGSLTYGEIARYARSILSGNDASIFVEDPNIEGLIYVRSSGVIVDYRGDETVLNITNPLIHNYTAVDDHAFEGTNIQSITLPSTVTTIGANAFANCLSLTDVSLKSVEEIKEYAFANCTALKTVTLPASVKTVQNHAFYECTALSEANLESSTITEFGDYAFAKCTSLSTVKLPNSLRKTGNHTFEGCTALETITLNSSLTEVGDYAFYKCTALSEVNLPVYYFNKIGSYAFAECSSLARISLPNTLTTIGDYAFTKTPLVSISLSFNVQTLGVGAFKECVELKTVTFPSALKVIPNEAFYGCTEFNPDASAFSNFNSIGEYAFAYTGGDKISLSSGVKLMEGAFANTKITSLSIPAVSELPNKIFYECVLLESLELSNSISKIGSYAFEKCAALTSVTLPTNLTSLGYRAFAQTGLTSVFIPSGILTLDGYVFEDCHSLEEATLTTKLSAGMFSHCSSLAKINFGSVTEIPVNAFKGCVSLTSITIPKTVTAIGNEAFMDCSGLSKVVIPSSVTTMGYRVFAASADGPAVSITLFCEVRKEVKPAAWNSEWNLRRSGTTGYYNTYFDGEWEYNSNGEPVKK